MWDFTWKVSDCEELVGYLMEHLGKNQTNYFMYQWAGPDLNILTSGYEFGRLFNESNDNSDLGYFYTRRNTT